MRRSRRFGRRAAQAAVAAAALSLALPILALAEEGESSESSGFALLIPNMDEFIPMIIAFLIMWLVFAKLVYPMLIGIIDKRANMIKDNLEQAEQSKLDAARLLEEREQLLVQAKTDAAEIISEARSAAEANRARIESEAHEQAQSIIDRAHQTVEAEKRTAVSELQQSVADLSVAVAGRLIGQDLSDEQHRKIIERYVEEAGSLNAGR